MNPQPDVDFSFLDPKVQELVYYTLTDDAHSAALVMNQDGKQKFEREIDALYWSILIDLNQCVFWRAENRIFFAAAVNRLYQQLQPRVIDETMDAQETPLMRELLGVFIANLFIIGRESMASQLIRAIDKRLKDGSWDRWPQTFANCNNVEKYDFAETVCTASTILAGEFKQLYQSFRSRVQSGWLDFQAALAAAEQLSDRKDKMFLFADTLSGMFSSAPLLPDVTSRLICPPTNGLLVPGYLLNYAEKHRPEQTDGWHLDPAAKNALTRKDTTNIFELIYFEKVCRFAVTEYEDPDQPNQPKYYLHVLLHPSVSTNLTSVNSNGEYDNKGLFNSMVVHFVPTLWYMMDVFSFKPAPPELSFADGVTAEELPQYLLDHCRLPQTLDEWQAGYWGEKGSLAAALQELAAGVDTSSLWPLNEGRIWHRCRDWGFWNWQDDENITAVICAHDGAHPVSFIFRHPQDGYPDEAALKARIDELLDAAKILSEEYGILLGVAVTKQAILLDFLFYDYARGSLGLLMHSYENPKFSVEMAAHWVTPEQWRNLQFYWNDLLEELRNNNDNAEQPEPEAS